MMSKRDRLGKNVALVLFFTCGVFSIFFFSGRLEEAISTLEPKKIAGLPPEAPYIIAQTVSYYAIMTGLWVGALTMMGIMLSVTWVNRLRIHARDRNDHFNSPSK